MAAITIQRASKQFGPQVVLEEVSLELHAGETVGIVGVNGCGKSTLFRMITGDEAADTGTVTVARDVKVGLLKQEPELAIERTLHDEVGSVFAGLLALEQKLHAVSDRMAASSGPDLDTLMEEYERINERFIAAGGHTFEARLNEVLGGLGFAQADYVLPIAALSGGQKCRAALAKLLLQDSSFLLLDEPTNHLDIDAVRWLEKYLAGHHGGAAIVSHDRYLLDRLCTRIIEVAQRKVTSFPGNYTNYAKTLHVRTLTQERDFEKHAEFIRKERQFIARHLAGQRTKEAQGRRKRLERRIKAGEFVTEAPETRRSAKLAFATSDVTDGTVLRCDDLAMRYGDNVLFGGLTFQVHAGERLGITGPNGTGKTTLLKIIQAEVEPTGGCVQRDSKRTVGYYAQEAGHLDPEQTILAEVHAARPELSEQDVRSLLGAYLFTREEVFKKLGSLSGGEQSRVRLAKLILGRPEVLMLDEPTNHLDIPSREMFEEALLAFGGAIIVVSHDRYFLDRIIDRLLVIRRDGHAMHAGNYSAYLEQAERLREADSATKIRRRKTGRTTPGRSKPKKEKCPYADLTLEELEARVIETETALENLNERFGDPEVCKDPAALATLRETIESRTEELAAMNRAWEQRIDAE